MVLYHQSKSKTEFKEKESVAIVTLSFFVLTEAKTLRI